MTNLPNQLTLPLIVFAVIVGMVLLSTVMRFGDNRTKEALVNYQTGENAQNLSERKEAFNKALDLYMALDNKYHPEFGTGWLYYNMGNTYYQLEEYPWAIYYYQKARTLLPRDAKVAGNLSKAQQKLAITPTNQASPFSKVFFFHSYFSLPERLQIFFLFTLLFFILLSVYLWSSKSWAKIAMLASAIAASIMLLSLAYTRYLSPVEAVIIKSVDLRRDAGMQYAKISNKPLPSGTMVEVLDVLPNDGWLKISYPPYDSGYVPQESIRLL